jgi:uncharacterized caspase-like protein
MNPFRRKQLPVIAFMLSLAVPLLPVSAQAQDGRRVALVIGNSAYAVNPLRNPVNDARDIGAALREVGFEVSSLQDASREQMEKGITDFGRALKAGGTGLFYYAGHGVQMKGRNYLIPVGVSIEEADEVSYKAVDADLVLAKMESAGNGTNIIILDACRNNPFPGADRAVGSRGLAVVGVQPAGSYIIYATQPNATAQDGTGRNGVFTRNLLAHIRTAGLDVDLMVRRVRDGVKAETNGTQVPWSNSSLSSAGFMFVPGGGSSSAATPAAEPAQVVASAKPRLRVARSYGSLVISAATAGTLYLDGVSLGELRGPSSTMSRRASGDWSCATPAASARKWARPSRMARRRPWPSPGGGSKPASSSSGPIRPAPASWSTVRTGESPH